MNETGEGWRRVRLLAITPELVDRGGVRGSMMTRIRARKVFFFFGQCCVIVHTVGEAKRNKTLSADPGQAVSRESWVLVLFFLKTINANS